MPPPKTKNKKNLRLGSVKEKEAQWARAEGPCLPHCAAKSDDESHFLAGLFIGATLAVVLAVLL